MDLSKLPREIEKKIVEYLKDMIWAEKFEKIKPKLMKEIHKKIRTYYFASDMPTFSEFLYTMGFYILSYNKNFPVYNISRINNNDSLENNLFSLADMFIEQSRYLDE